MPGTPPSGPAGASAEQSTDAFAPENFSRVALIQLMRLYDVQLALLSCMDPDKAQELVNMHEQGITFMPDPIFAMEAEEEQDGNQAE